MSNGQDPRTIVTPDAFSVAPELLGLPLARPWRRAVAMLIDLVLIALLANARGVFLALAAGAFLFWMAYRGRKAQLGSKVARASIGCGGALLVFVAVVGTWGSLFLNEDTVLFETEDAAGEGVPVTIGTALDVASILGADDSLEAEAAAARIMERLAAQGISSAQMGELISDAARDADGPTMRAIERAAARSRSGPDLAEQPLDSVWTAYANARAAGDTARLREIAPALGRRLAPEDWTAQEQQVVRLETRNESLQQDLRRAEEALEAERTRGLMDTVLGFFDELGLGIGWSGLYFTFLTAFYKGRTPGKKLLGIRVLRLDGNPVTYWLAFERFGGYAASLFTGMEGFLRILWDRNRQGLEDKLAETVVIRETKAARAQLAGAAIQRGTSDRPWRGSAAAGP